LSDVVTATRQTIKSGELATIIIFDDVTSERIELDFSGSDKKFLKMLDELTTSACEASHSRTAETDTAKVHDAEQPEGQPAESTRSVGRPRLGVVAREVTLLPRHWEWLTQQPGGASVALRKLVENARKANSEKDRLLRAQESCYKFISIMAGDEPGFEEAARALYAGDQNKFNDLIRTWPADVRDHATHLGHAVFNAV
jgi:hypothetical protein